MNLCLAITAFAANAQEPDKPTMPDAIACFKAVDPLGVQYRSILQPQCIGVAFDFCTTREDANTCLTELSTSLRAYYDVLMPMLPVQIDGEGFHPKLYERAIKRARDTFDHLPPCDGLSGDDYTICEVTTLAATTIDLLYRARRAGVSLL